MATPKMGFQILSIKSCQMKSISHQWASALLEQNFEVTIKKKLVVEPTSSPCPSTKGAIKGYLSLVFILQKENSPLNTDKEFPDAFQKKTKSTVFTYINIL